MIETREREMEVIYVFFFSLKTERLGEDKKKRRERKVEAERELTNEFLD